jgi:hypothetical protein
MEEQIKLSYILKYILYDLYKFDDKKTDNTVIFAS